MTVAEADFVDVRCADRVENFLRVSRIAAGQKVECLVAAAIRGIAMGIEPVEDDLQRGLRRNRSSDNDAVAVDRIDDRAGIAIRERSRSSGRVARAARITVGDFRAVTRVVHIDAITTIAANIP